MAIHIKSASRPYSNGRAWLPIVLLVSVIAISVSACSNLWKPSQRTFQFIYTSDSHFGITRPTFQGNSNVGAYIVNGAMVQKMNSLPKMHFPEDNGVNAGKIVGGIDYLINTGDIANRSESGIQNAAVSWAEFTNVYLNGLNTLDNEKQKTKIWLLPGNHDVSNAIGQYHIPAKQTDNSSMVGIFNYMYPTCQTTKKDYSYSSGRIHYSKDIAGIHFLFVCMWPDSCERVWMAQNLKSVSDTTPVLLFVHDEPNVEAKHFTNPNDVHNINSTDKFENLLAEVFKDGKDISAESKIEQRGFVSFLKAHGNIKVYFHGNDNENRYYEYHGPDNDIDLKIIQVDSPMKGNISANDETKLSFQVVSVNPEQKVMTVRECLWNSDPARPDAHIKWGESITISLK